MYRAVACDEVLVMLLSRVTNLISVVLSEDVDSDKKLSNISLYSNECIDLCCKLGLNYGHHIGKRKCSSDFLSTPVHKVDTINMSLSFSGVIDLINAVKKAMSEQSQIYLVSRYNTKCNYSKLVYLSKWIPGTLTNKAVKKSYESRYNIKLSGTPKLIISLNTSVYEVISNEVNIYCNRTCSFIRVVTFIDSNVRATKMYNNVTCIMMNDESAYYSLFVNHLINTVFDYITNK